MKRVMLACALVCAFAVACFAQDPVKVDPKHYKVESENAKVRVLRIHYGPHEKSVMHRHPASVVVYLTDATTKMTTPDGKSQVVSGKAGEAHYADAGSHLPENVGDKDFDAILVELKSPKAAAK
jgi:beta-alanine degradation protein BauB